MIYISNIENLILGPFLDMPPLMTKTGGALKKEAAKRITEYNKLPLEQKKAGEQLEGSNLQP